MNNQSIISCKQNRVQKSLKPYNNRKRLLIFYLTYTFVFAVLFFLCFGIHLLINDKSLLHRIDSFNMHYSSYIYAGRLFKAFFKNPEIRMWEPNIGYGADILNLIGGYFTDPLYLATLWIPEKYSETVFNAIVVFRLYLTGISFSILSFKRGNRFYPTFCGMIIYTFSSCAYIGLNQSGFLIPLYIVPLLIIGADELYEKKKPTLYVILLAYYAMTSFYFVYMFAIMLVCYCLLKWILTPKANRTIKDLIGKVFMFFFYSAWSALIAAFTLVPLAFVMKEMGRLGLRRYVPVLYDFEFYKDFYQGYITSFNMLGRESMLGSSVIVFLSLIVLFMLKRKDYLRLKIEIILMTLGLLIPFVGYIFNGMNYPANRWSHFYILVLSYMTVVIIPEIPSLSKKKRLLLITVTALYFFLGMTVFNAGVSGFAVIAVFALAISVLILFLDKLPKKYYGYICIAIACISVIPPAFYKYSVTTSTSMIYLVPAGKGYSLLTEENGLRLINGLEVNDGTRYNHAETVMQYKNTSMLTGKSGTNFYFNFYNDYIDRFHQSICLNCSPCNFNYDGLDNRSELMALLGVNYYLINDEPSALPVGYEPDNALEYQQYKLLTSKYKNSLFTLFDRSVSEKEFNELSPAQKQEVLMKACVTDISSDDSNTLINNLKESEIPYAVDSCDEGVTITNNTVSVTKENTGFVLTFDKICDAELYFYIKNFDKNELYPVDYFVRINGLNDGEEISVHSTYFISASYIFHMYGGKHNWLINVGKTTTPVDQLHITFDAPGTYSFECMKLYKNDITSIEENIKGLDHGISNLELLTDKVRLDCNTKTDKYLFMAIPYSSGWKAYDNGQRVDILHGDIGFMALKLSPGNHQIELQYERPGFKAGLIISCVSLTAFIVYEVITRKKKA